MARMYKAPTDGKTCSRKHYTHVFKSKQIQKLVLDGYSRDGQPDRRAKQHTSRSYQSLFATILQTCLKQNMIVMIIMMTYSVPLGVSHRVLLAAIY